MGSERGRRRYPDFLCIGAQKAGTTWVYANLRRHPSIWLPPEKELHYFDEKVGERQTLRAKLRGDSRVDRRWRRQFRRRLRSYRRGGSLATFRWDVRYLFGSPDDDWYGSLFVPAGDRVTGEITPAYATLDRERVARVHRLVPEARILFFLRNPVERAWSHASMAMRILGTSPESWAEFARAEEAVLRSDYARTLEVWRSLYPDEQMFVGFLEDVRFRPLELLERICSFLGVDTQLPTDRSGKRVHAGTGATIPAEAAAALAHDYRDAIAELAERFGGHTAWWDYLAGRLVEEEPSGAVEFPFVAGRYWRDWLAENGLEPDWTPPLQSGALPELEGARQVR